MGEAEAVGFIRAPEETEDFDLQRNQATITRVGRDQSVDIDQRPLESGVAVAFQSPESFEVTLDTPNRGPIAGLGIAEGVTLIVGGGFHGKSTLLNALERGVYNHRPGDGREFQQVT